MMWRTALTLPALLGMAASASTEPSSELPVAGAEPRWVDRFGTDRTDWANRFIELRDGTLGVAGFVNRDDAGGDSNWDMILRRYGSAGRLLWSRRIGGAELDAAWSLSELPGGRLVMAGFSATGSAGAWDASLTITDRAGRVLADKRFGGKGDDRATDLVQLAGGDLLLVGQSDSGGAGGIDVFVVRIDRNGEERWRRTYGTANDDRAFLGLPMPDGGAILAGVTGPRGAYDLLLMRIDQSGGEVWRRVAGGAGNDATHGLAALPDGRIVHAGYGPSWGGRGNDVSLLVYSPSGELLSHQAIGGPGDDRVQFVTADADGSLWFTGYTKSFSSEWRMMVGRMGADGAVEPWMAAIAGPGDMHGSTIALARNGDLLLGGYAVPVEGAAPDAFVLRADPVRLARRTDGVEVRRIPAKAAP